MSIMIQIDLVLPITNVLHVNKSPHRLVGSSFPFHHARGPMGPSLIIIDGYIKCWFPNKILGITWSP